MKKKLTIILECGLIIYVTFTLMTFFIQSQHIKDIPKGLDTPNQVLDYMGSVKEVGGKQGMLNGPLIFASLNKQKLENYSYKKTVYLLKNSKTHRYVFPVISSNTKKLTYCYLYRRFDDKLETYDDFAVPITGAKNLTLNEASRPINEDINKEMSESNFKNKKEEKNSMIFYVRIIKQ